MLKKIIIAVLFLVLGAGGVLGGLWYINEKPETLNISEAIAFSESLVTHSADLATAQSEVSELSEDLATAQSEVSELIEDLATAQSDLATAQSEVSELSEAEEAYLWLLSRQNIMAKQSVFYEGENIGAFSPKYLNEATPFEYDFEFSGSIERNALTQTAVVYGSAVYNDMQTTIPAGNKIISYNLPTSYIGAMFDWGCFVTEDNSNIPRVVVAEDAQKFETALLNNERFEDTIKVILNLNNGAKALLNMNLNVNITNI